MIKKLLLLISFLVFLTGNLTPQNLIQNPGFEDGMSHWDNLWTRDSGVGYSRIANDTAHTGNRAIQIKHWGTNDWSFKQTGKFYVSEGNIYRFDAWVNVVHLHDYAEMSFALFDSNNQSIDWSANPNYFHTSEDQYQHFTTWLAIPPGVAYVWPRFVGGGLCEIYLDDIEFELIGSMGSNKSHFIENEHLKVEIITPSFEMNFLNKHTGQTWSSQPTPFMTITGIDSTLNSFVFSGKIISGNQDFSISATLTDQALTFELMAAPEAQIGNEIAFPGFITSNPGDYLIVPWATGMILPVEEEFPFWEFSMYSWKSTMAFCGVTNLSGGYMIVSDDPWDTRISFLQPQENNLSTIQLVHESSKSEFGHNRKFSLVFIDTGGYVEMAGWYRNHAEELGYVKTFDEKIATNPNVAKLEGAIDFWALHWEFMQAGFIDSLYHFGIDKAIISLSGGWYVWDEVSEVIESINSHGLLSSRYDIFTDVWPPDFPEYLGYRSEGYPEDVIVNEDGSLLEGWLAYIDDSIPFQGFYTCSATHPEYAASRLTELDTNHYNCRFIDVELSSELHECFSPDHPTTRHQDAMHRVEALDVVKNQFSLVTGSEEARDFAFQVVDYGEGTMSVMPVDGAGYDWMTPVDEPDAGFVNYNMNPARRIPLHGLVYHDVHVPTWYTGDGVSKVPAYWDDKDLFNILYASMPLFMPPSYEYWIENREKFLTSAQLISSVSANCGFSKMTAHTFLTTDKLVQQTEFENGWKVVVNFGQDIFNDDDKILHPKGFYASDGTNEVYRIQLSGNTIAAANTADRTFLNPGGVEFASKGIRSSSAVLLKKTENSLELSFLGNQTFVDINPEQFSWPLLNVGVTTLGSQIPVIPQVLDSGWLRINKTNNEIFYSISGDFIRQLKITIPKGWSGISSTIEPTDSNIENLLSSIHPELVIIENQTGKFYPSGNINTLVNWQITSGYQIKVTDSVELTINGTVSQNRSLQLKPGWNLIPVLSSCNVNIAQLFEGKNPVIIKEVASFNVCWPQMNITSLQFLSPGKSYLVLMNSNEEIEFPVCENQESLFQR